MKVLIIQQKMIGDVLTSSILCEAIKARFNDLPAGRQQSEVHYLINSHTVAVVENNPYIDRLVLFTPEMEKSTKARNKLFQFLQNEHYDTVIDVYSKLGSAQFTRATKAKTRIGYYKWYTQWAYTDTFSYDRNPKTVAGLAIENRMKLLLPLGSDFPPFTAPKIYLTKEEIEIARTALIEGNIDLNRPIAMVSLLGSSKEKTYPLAYMATLLDTLVDHKNIQLLLNFIPKQQPEVDKLLSLVKEKTKQYIFSTIYGKSLREFLALTSHCTMTIGNEGGAINMAKALDIPTFSIFSPWITREAWGIFENEQNASFHLKDIDPELYRLNEAKYLKKEYDRFYKLMTPEVIWFYLKKFLNNQL